MTKTLLGSLCQTCLLNRSLMVISLDCLAYLGDKYLSSLEEVLKIAPLPVLRVVAKKYQLDITKV